MRQLNTKGEQEPLWREDSVLHRKGGEGMAYLTSVQGIYVLLIIMRYRAI
jgi:hypothetical protein